MENEETSILDETNEPEIDLEEELVFRIKYKKMFNLSLLILGLLILIGILCYVQGHSAGYSAASQLCPSVSSFLL
jgi:hypothetical protein